MTRPPIRWWHLVLLGIACLGACDDGPPVTTSADTTSGDTADAPNASADTTADVAADSAPDVGPPRVDTPSPVEIVAAEDVPPPGPEPIADPPEMVVGTWNLKNFSPYGTSEFRLEDIAAKIEQLAPDVLAIQEIKVKEGSEGEGEQAWGALLDELEGYEGLVNPWNPMDSVVGLLYDPSVVTVLAWKTLFEGEWWPFPRAPLEATLRLTRDGKQVTFKVIVLHLKAFPEGAERRREACEDLDAYLSGLSSPTAIVIGDFNDNPHDGLDDNVFMTSLQDHAPTYDFVTADMPVGTVTSLGYYHVVDGQVVTGEFLDHAVVTERFALSYETIDAQVVSRPPEDYEWYESTYSDHFPVLVHFTP